MPTVHSLLMFFLPFMAPFLFVAADAVPLSTTYDADAVPLSTTYDVLVYGSTPGGVMASIAAARHNATVLLIDPSPRVGGVMSGGLGKTDKGNPVVIGGLAGEFFLRNAQVYNTNATIPEYDLEPHVAENIFLEMLREEATHLTHLVTNGARVVSIAMTTSSPPTIRSITLEDGSTHFATVFIDATYQGDVMTRTPGVETTFGRESRIKYNESYAGRRDPYGYMDWAPVSPYKLVNGQAQLMYPLVTNEYAAPLGDSDDKVQDYNFRLCVTKMTQVNQTSQQKSPAPAAAIPFPKPPQYNRSDWELLFKYANVNTKNGTIPDKLSHYLNSFGTLPNGKYDLNNGGLISTDCTGCQWSYPNASYAQRDAIHALHKKYQQGYLWTLAHDESMDVAVRNELNTYGLCGDEFLENHGWPEQLYVREASRLVGGFILTETEVLQQHDYDASNRSIGMGSYAFDAHYSHRGPCIPNTNPIYIDPKYHCYGTGPDNKCPCAMLTKELAETLKLTPEQKANSSIVWTGGEGYAGPNTELYQFPYELLLPKRKEVSNMLCPLTPSASHVGLATVRMEPQFMITSHSAGVAAALAVATAKAAMSLNSSSSTNTVVVVLHDIDLGKLRTMLLNDKQILGHPY